MLAAGKKIDKSSAATNHSSNDCEVTWIALTLDWKALREKSVFQTPLKKHKEGSLNSVVLKIGNLKLVLLSMLGFTEDKEQKYARESLVFENILNHALFTML